MGKLGWSRGSVAGTLAVVTALTVCKLDAGCGKVVLSGVLPRCQTRSERLRGIKQLAGA